MSAPEEPIVGIDARPAIVSIMGVPIHIEYAVVQFGQVTWALVDGDARAAQQKAYARLLEILLRVHYTPFIESQLRDQWFREEYEESMAGIGRDFEDISF